MSKNKKTQEAFNLEQHLKQEHQRTTFGEFLREIVYGGLDGIVTTFAVVASFTGASISGLDTTTASFVTVLLFGLGNLFADGVSMGLGDFLSSRSENDLANAEAESERAEIQENTQQERKETIAILQSRGFSKDQAETLTNIYETNEDYWVDWMVQNEINALDSLSDNPALTGLATFISFIIFGAIPLIPFAVFADQPTETVAAISAGTTALALLILGTIRWRVTGQKVIRSIGEVLIIGGIAAASAFVVGSVFG